MQRISRSESLTEKAYKQIKASIVNNHVEVKEYLAEEKIANELGISRTPIREALKQLAFEGLVELNKGSKACVSSVSPGDAVNYQKIRERLESLAVGLSTKNITDKDIEDLRHIAYEQQKCIEENDFHQFIELDHEFHNYIAVLSGNSKLKEFIENLNNHIQRFLVLTNTLGQSAEEAIDEHHKIIDAMQTNDSEQVEMKMQDHIEKVTKRIMEIK